MVTRNKKTHFWFIDSQVVISDCKLMLTRASYIFALEIVISFPRNIAHNVDKSRMLLESTRSKMPIDMYFFPSSEEKQTCYNDIKSVLRGITIVNYPMRSSTYFLTFMCLRLEVARHSQSLVEQNVTLTEESYQEPSAIYFNSIVR